ncbi:MAG: hypothetical protein HYR51_04085 [Candidatus Rokubacteria bacterium]|nr:hypothetical protein [Candidatus Rokubacteria bacterium]
MAAADDLTVRARLLDEPSLWCWEISEAKSGRIVETSWSSEWMAYDSPDEALAAGQRRLAELTGRSPS